MCYKGEGKEGAANLITAPCHVVSVLLVISVIIIVFVYCVYMFSILFNKTFVILKAFILLFPVSIRGLEHYTSSSYHLATTRSLVVVLII